jgi:uncharacterized membrane protein YhaH (DUF805 family)
MISLRQLYFSTEGRVDRRTYVALALLPFAFFSTAAYIFISTNVVAMTALSFIAGWLLISVQIKRWHDLSLSGAWTFLAFVPIAGQFISLALAFLPGSRGLNKYDEDYAGTDESNTRDLTLLTWVTIAAALFSAPIIALSVAWTIELYEGFEGGYYGAFFQVGIVIIAGAIYLGLTAFMLALVVSSLMLSVRQALQRNGWP